MKARSFEFTIFFGFIICSVCIKFDKNKMQEATQPVEGTQISNQDSFENQ